MIFASPATFWLLLVSAPLQPGGGPNQDKEAALRAELQLLQGSWQVEMQEENGEKVADDQVKERIFAFGKNAFFVKHKNVVVQIGLCKFDPTKNPKTINAMIVQGDNKDDIIQGIYAVEGDTLKVCFDKDGQQRPKEFKTAPKSGYVLLVCKRIRAKGEDEDLAGNYKSESTEVDGSKHTADVTIERVGDAYLVTYRKNKGIYFVGIGIRKGDVFSMSWANQGQIGVSVYQIEKGPRLVGQFTQLGGPGVLGMETLTRVLKEV